MCVARCVEALIAELQTQDVCGPRVLLLWVAWTNGESREGRWALCIGGLGLQGWMCWLWAVQPGVLLLDCMSVVPLVLVQLGRTACYTKPEKSLPPADVFTWKRVMEEPHRAEFLTARMIKIQK